MAGIRVVLFDLFDTLVDLALEELAPVHVDGQLVSPTAPELHAALAEAHDVPLPVFLQALRGVDRSYRESRYRDHVELPTDERFRAVLEALEIDDPGLVARLTGVHMGRLKAQVRHVPGHGEVLATLAERYRLGLCSNFTHAPTAEAILEESGLRRYLHAEAISETVGYRKPRGEIFLAAIESFDVAPEEVLHVGDNLAADVAGAAALGMQTAWLTRRVKDPDAAFRHHEGPPPTHTVPTLPALLPHLP